MEEKRSLMTSLFPSMKYLGKDGDRLYFDLWKEVKSAF